MESTDDLGDFNNDLSHLTMDFNRVGLIGTVQYVPFEIGISFTDTIKKANVVFEYDGIRNLIILDMPTVEHIKRKNPKRTNGFLEFRSCLLGELKKSGLL